MTTRRLHTIHKAPEAEAVTIIINTRYPAYKENKVSDGQHLAKILFETLPALTFQATLTKMQELAVKPPMTAERIGELIEGARK